MNVIHLPSIADIDGCQRRALGEHAIGTGATARIETCEVNYFQLVTIIEHPTKIFHILGIETAHVQCLQLPTLVEYHTHRFHLARVKTAQVYTSQFLTSREQEAHVCHLARVQILHVGDFCQIAHPVEPLIYCCWTRIGKRSIEHHLSYLRSYSTPARIVATHIQGISRATCAFE